MSYFSRISKLLVCLTGLICTAVQAHPHNWIDLKTELNIDDQLRLTGIHMRWQFDPYYSITVLSEFQQNGKSPEQQLHELGELMVTNLGNEGYYSKLLLNNSPLPLPVPDSWALTAEAAQLTLSMDFTLQTPVPIKGLPLSLSTYDPTYYVSMNYSSSHDLILSPEVSSFCQWELILPKPTQEMVEYAARLDQTVKDSEGLGVLFAEKMELSCQR